MRHGGPWSPCLGNIFDLELELSPPVRRLFSPIRLATKSEARTISRHDCLALDSTLPRSVHRPLANLLNTCIRVRS